MKRIVKYLALGVALVSVSGCSKKTDNTLQIGVAELGYGIQWLNNLASEFTKQTGQKVKITPHETLQGSATLDTDLESKESKFDIIFNKRGAFAADIHLKKGFTARSGDKAYHDCYYLDITDSVYEYTVPGESKSIKEKMNDYIEDYYNFNGKYYGVAWASGFMGIVKNNYVWELAGFDDDDMPYTTDQLMALCDRLYELNLKIPGTSMLADRIYPFMYTRQYEYYSPFVNIWAAQYEGKSNIETYYMNGYGPKQTEYNQHFYSYTGQVEALNVLQQLIKGNEGHRQHPIQTSVFTDMQNDFIAGEALFNVNGSWLETEAKSTSRNDIEFIKTPVVSALKNKLTIADDIDADEKLATAVKFVDAHPEVGDNVGANLPEADMEIVREARHYQYQAGGSDHTGYIVSYSARKNAAIDFFRFMYSDVGLNIYYNTLGGCCLPAKPCNGYGTLTGTSPFMKSVIKGMDEAYFFLETNKSVFFSLGGVNFLYGCGTLGSGFKLVDEGKDANTIVSSNREWIKDNLQTILDEIAKAKD